jgi:hypothetical protein
MLRKIVAKGPRLGKPVKKDPLNIDSVLLNGSTWVLHYSNLGIVRDYAVTIQKIEDGKSYQLDIPENHTGKPVSIVLGKFDLEKDKKQMNVWLPGFANAECWVFKRVDQ